MKIDVGAVSKWKIDVGVVSKLTIGVCAVTSRVMWGGGLAMWFIGDREVAAFCGLGAIVFSLWEIAEHLRSRP